MSAEIHKFDGLMLVSSGRKPNICQPILLCIMYSERHSRSNCYLIAAQCVKHAPDILLSSIKFAGYHLLMLRDTL